MQRDASETGLNGNVDDVRVSPAMQNVLKMADRVAAVDTPILLLGESGSGKEWLAQYIHSRSPRAVGPFNGINCCALPEGLLESELFGHVRGAFTGADRENPGLFLASENGTLLLDEIGELPLSMQAKLLRVLQDREVRKVGGTQSRAINVRLFAATNRNLEEMVRAHTFRQDLFYRLKIVTIELPPLRERREDILPLAQLFISRSCCRYHCGPCSITPRALARLQAYPWPGNVRELAHAIERAVVLAEGKPSIEEGDLPPEVVQGGPALSEAEESELTLAAVERRHILRTLKRFGGNRRETAEALAISSNTLWRKLREYGVLRSEKNAPAPDDEPDSNTGYA